MLDTASRASARVLADECFRVETASLGGLKGEESDGSGRRTGGGGREARGGC